MSVDDLYDELYAIAGKIGELSEMTVKGAKLLLAQPRYADSPNPAALLVEDLKRVIASIPKIEEERRPKTTPPPHSTRYFRAWAQRYFSLDADGQTISHRRNFGRKRVNGAEITWMNRGVIYRVLAGLFELWAESSIGDITQPASTLPDYQLEGVSIYADILEGYDRDVLGSTWIDLALYLRTPGPHIVPVDLAYATTRLIDTVTEEPKRMQTILFPDDPISQSFGSDTPIVIQGVTNKISRMNAIRLLPSKESVGYEGVHIAGYGPRTSIRLRFECNHNPQSHDIHHQSSATSQLPILRYRVDVPMDILTLEIRRGRTPPNTVWRLGKQSSPDADREILDESSEKQLWAIEPPDVGTTYTLELIKDD